MTLPELKEVLEEELNALKILIRDGSPELGACCKKNVEAYSQILDILDRLDEGKIAEAIVNWNVEKCNDCDYREDDLMCCVAIAKNKCKHNFIDDEGLARSIINFITKGGE